MNLIALPALTDNPRWMFHEGRAAVVVDPGESAPVIAALEARPLTLAAILVTTTVPIASAMSTCCARACSGRPALRQWKNDFR